MSTPTILPVKEPCITQAQQWINVSTPAIPPVKEPTSIMSAGCQRVSTPTTLPVKEPCITQAQQWINVSTPTILPVKEPVEQSKRRPDRPWKVIVLDDPVNLMSYVTYVFRKLFGYSQQKAHRLMMQVHTEGKAVVSSGPREKSEFDVYRLHEHGLWAILEQD